MWNQALSTRSRPVLVTFADPSRHRDWSSESSESSHRGRLGPVHGLCKRTDPVPFMPQLQALCRGILRHHGGQDPRLPLPATNQSKKVGPIQKVDPTPATLQLPQASGHGSPLPHVAQDPRHLRTTNRCQDPVDPVPSTRHRHPWHLWQLWHWPREIRHRGRDPKHHQIRWRSKFAVLREQWTLPPACQPPRGCRGSPRCR